MAQCVAFVHQRCLHEWQARDKKGDESRDKQDINGAAMCLLMSVSGL